MFAIKVFVDCPALEKLAAAISGPNKPSGMPTWCDAVVTDAQEKTTANPDKSYAPAPAPVSPVQAAAPSPAPSPAPATASVPTAPPVMPPVAPAPAYTMEQVGKAGADLVAANPGMMPTLMGLMQKYGVTMVTDLKPEQLGPFATELRALGGKI